MFPTFTSTEASPLRTRFIIVNDRVPFQAANCAICGRKIERGYVRESQTRLLYCDNECIPEHARRPWSPSTIAPSDVS
jgi:hypothetical protein